MIEMTTVEARENFSELINKAAYGKEHILLKRRGKPLAILIPFDTESTIIELKKRKK